jgi:hypothetical protein
MQLQELQEIETFFIKLNPKEAYSHSAKIREFARTYFSHGNMTQYNSVFSRYIKNMRDLNDTEMHQFLIKYLISSVIKRNYELFYSDVSTIRVNYIQYDVNIYIFLLKFISGHFSEAADLLLNINQNIYEDFWNFVNPNDMALYFTLSILINFKLNVLKEIQKLSQTLVYNFFEENPELFEILENYSKCRYDWITLFLEKLQVRITSDPFQMNNCIKMSYLVKNNILFNILKTTSSVPINYLSYILNEKNHIIIENWILSGISEGKFKVKIDDIDRVVYSSEISSLENTIGKTLGVSRKVHVNSINKILNSLNMSSRPMDLRYITLDQMTRYTIEKSEKRHGKFNINSDINFDL